MDSRCSSDEHPTARDDEAALLAILASPAEPGETYAQAFRRKEHAFLARCAALSPVSSLTLRRRLANPLAGDRLAEQFARLVIERRNRILHFLADARRRAVLAAER